jgi:hypothetical protein
LGLKTLAYSSKAISEGWQQSIGIQLRKLMPKQRLTKVQKKAVEILTEHGKTEYEFDEKTGIQLQNKVHIKAVTMQALIDKGLLVKVKETNFASKPGSYNPATGKWDGAKCHSIIIVKTSF